MVVDFGNSVIIDIQVTDESYRLREVRGFHLLTLYFNAPGHVDIPVGATVEFEGETFTLKRPSNFIKNNTQNYEYTLILEAADSQLKTYIFRDITTGRIKFSLTDKPAQLLQFLVDNLNTRDSGWTVGNVVEATEKTISFDSINCADALNQIADEFNTEWEIDGKEISLHKVERFKSDPLPLSYGKGNGFISGVGRQSGDKEPVEILFVQGGDKNIDFSKYGSKTLLLPKNKTLEYNGRTYKTDADGLSIQRDDKALNTNNEAALDLSNIYPKRVGTVTAVQVVDEEKHFYDIEDSTIPSSMDYNDALIEGEEMIVKFETGRLAGREFETKYNHQNRTFQLVPAELDGQTMPNLAFKPEIGDQYAVFGMNMPQAYISDDETKTGASWEMFEEAAKFLYEHEEQAFSFSGTLDGIWSKNNWNVLRPKLQPGCYVAFSDTQWQPDGIDVRIVAVKDYVNNPHSPEITLSNEPINGTFTSIINKVKTEPVNTRELVNQAVGFAKRRYAAAIETNELITKALLQEFSESINPLTINTMQLIAGSPTLQFRFVNSKTSPSEATHNFNYSKSTLKLTTGSGTIQHMTLGINSIKINHEASEYKFWDVASFASGVLTENVAQYLYIKASKSGSTATFELSQIPKQFEDGNYYYFLTGILNRADEEDEGRSFVKLYGFTEILPGQITTERVLGNNLLIDLTTGDLRGKVTFSTGSPAQEYVDVKSETEGTNAKNYADGAISNLNDQLIQEIEQAKNAAEQAAKDYADAQDNLLQVQQEAYADGVLTQAEQKAIQEAQAALQAAKQHSESQDDILQGILENYTDTELSNFEIRTRNILLDSDNFSNLNTSSGVSYTSTKVDDKYTNIKTTGGTGVLKVYKTLRDSLEKYSGEYATYTTYIKNNSDTTPLVIRHNGLSPAGEWTINPQEEILFKVNVRISNSTTISHQIQFRGETAEAKLDFDISPIMMVLGDRAVYDWTPAPEDVKQQIQSAKDDAEQSAKDYADAQDNLVKINQEAYADGVLTEAEQKAIQEANNALQAAKAHAENQDDILQGLLEQYTNTAIDDIEVGGRNYLLESEKEYLGTYLVNTYTSSVPIDDNQLWTISGEYLVPPEKNPTIMFYWGNGTRSNAVWKRINGIQNDGEWHRFEITAESDSPDSTKLRFYGSNSSTDASGKPPSGFRKIKLEKATKASDWSPAPEDIQAEIQAAKEDAEQAAKDYADAQDEYYEVTTKAYADGKVTAEELRAIQDAEQKLQEAKAHAESKDAALKDVLEDYTDDEITGLNNSLQADITTARQNAEQAAKDYADAQDEYFETIVKSYADGKVTAEEQRAIADANAKLQQAKQHAESEDAALQGLLEDYSDQAISNLNDQLQADIAQAKQDAADAQQAADNAQIDATTAHDQLSDIASDSKLDPSEKKQVKKDWEAIKSEKAKLLSQAFTYNVSTSNYEGKYDALDSYISPKLSNMTTTDSITRSNFVNYFKEYYDAKIDLLQDIREAAESMVQDAAFDLSKNYIEGLGLISRNLVIGTGKAKLSSYANGGENNSTYLYNLDFDLIRGKYISLSFDWEYIGSSPGGTFRIQGDGPLYNFGNVGNLTTAITSSETSGHYVLSFTATSSSLTFSKIGIRLDDVVGQVKISNLKVEYGEPSPWNPAIDDLSQEAYDLAKDYVDGKIADIGTGGNLFSITDLTTDFYPNSGGNIQEGGANTYYVAVIEVDDSKLYSLSCQHRLASNRLRWAFTRVYPKNGTTHYGYVNYNSTNDTKFEGISPPAQCKYWVIEVSVNESLQAVKNARYQVEEGSTATPFKPSLIDLSVMIEDAQQNLQAIETLQEKTNYLQTTASGGVVATGTIAVGNNVNKDRAGITGQGSASDAVRLWSGDRYADRATAPWVICENGFMEQYYGNKNLARRMGRLPNGDYVDEIYNPNGQLAKRTGVIGGYITEEWYNNGSLVYQIGRNGIYYVREVPESWTPESFRSLGTNASDTALQNVIRANACYISSGGSYEYNWRNTNYTTVYLYAAGQNPNSQNNKQYEGYKKTNNSKTNNIDAGWYCRPSDLGRDFSSGNVICFVFRISSGVIQESKTLDFGRGSMIPCTI